jgi:DNA-binding CsgD family transcriptional regulator
MERSKGRPNDDARDYIEALGLFKVSEREAEVARLLTWHFKNRAIAEHLGNSVNTVKTHVCHLLTKLQCADRGEAAGEARRIVREWREARERQRRAQSANLKLVKRRKGQPPGRAAEPDGPAPNA